MKPMHPVPWTYDSERNGWVDADGDFVLCGHDVGDADFVVHACNMYQKFVGCMREMCSNYSTGPMDRDIMMKLLEEAGE